MRQPPFLDSDSQADLEKKIYLEELDESTLSRVHTMASDPNRAFVMISAFRNGLAPEVNVRRNIALAANINNLARQTRRGYGYFWLEGHSVENPGTPEEVHVVEDSLFVSGPSTEDKVLPNEIMKNDMLKLAKEYQQSSIFFKPAGGTTGSLVFTDGTEGPKSEFKPEKMGEYYSELRFGSHSGKKFRFEAREGRTGLSKWGMRQRLRQK